MNADKEQEFRAEAERLRLLPRDQQLAILDLHRSVAADAKVTKPNRVEARQRLQALERLLNLKKRKERKKKHHP